jgi:hypothetical protein
MPPVVDISDLYGFPAVMTLFGTIYKDYDILIADPNDESLKSWEKTDLLEKQEKNRIETITKNGDEFLELEDGSLIRVKKLLLMYWFPGTKPPTHPIWRKMYFDDDETDIPVDGLQWGEQPDRLKFINGKNHRSDSKTKLKYISKEGDYYRLRIKKQNFSARYATLESAIKKRSELLSQL